MDAWWRGKGDKSEAQPACILPGGGGKGKRVRHSLHASCLVAGERANSTQNTRQSLRAFCLAQLCHCAAVTAGRRSQVHHAARGGGDAAAPVD
eukprot:362355-Chlamydomonas_euryale.AAC.1